MNIADSINKAQNQVKKILIEARTGKKPVDECKTELEALGEDILTAGRNLTEKLNAANMHYNSLYVNFKQLRQSLTDLEANEEIKLLLQNSEAVRILDEWLNEN